MLVEYRFVCPRRLPLTNSTSVAKLDLFYKEINDTGAPNDGIFPNASEVSEMYHSVLGKPV